MLIIFQKSVLMLIKRFGFLKLTISESFKYTYTPNNSMATHLKLEHEIEDIAKARNEPKSKVMEEALKIGVAALWKESILDKYLTGKMSKKKAVSMVGKHLVLMAEKQKKAILQDIKWGLANA